MSLFLLGNCTVYTVHFTIDFSTSCQQLYYRYIFYSYIVFVRLWNHMSANIPCLEIVYTINLSLSIIWNLRHSFHTFKTNITYSIVVNATGMRSQNRAWQNSHNKIDQKNIIPDQLAPRRLYKAMIFSDFDIFVDFFFRNFKLIVHNMYLTLIIKLNSLA